MLDFAQITGSITPHEITPLHVQAVVALWRPRLGRTTLHWYVYRLRKTLEYIAAIANRPDLARLAPRVPSPQPRKVIATPPDLAALLAVAKPYMRCAILLAAHGGFRVSDVLRIAPAHFNAEAKTITIDQHKTGHTVSVPTSEALTAVLCAAPDTNDPTVPFVTAYHTHRVKYSAFSSEWQKLKARARCNPALTFHDLRRTIAVSLYEVSKDLRVVEQMLGHTSLASTVRYLEHRDPAKLKPYLDALHAPASKVIQ